MKRSTRLLLLLCTIFQIWLVLLWGAASTIELLIAERAFGRRRSHHGKQMLEVGRDFSLRKKDSFIINQWTTWEHPKVMVLSHKHIWASSFLTQIPDISSIWASRQAASSSPMHMAVLSSQLTIIEGLLMFSLWWFELKKLLLLLLLCCHHCCHISCDLSWICMIILSPHIHVDHYLQWEFRKHLIYTPCCHSWGTHLSSFKPPPVTWWCWWGGLQAFIARWQIATNIQTVYWFHCVQSSSSQVCCLLLLLHCCLFLPASSTSICCQTQSSIVITLLNPTFLQSGLGRSSFLARRLRRSFFFIIIITIACTLMLEYGPHIQDISR